MRGHIFILCMVSLVYLPLLPTGAIICYQCADTAKDEPCQVDFKGLMKSAVGDDDLYAKNCENSKVNRTLNMCMLEVYKTGDKILNFHRDCSDGKTFSFTGEYKLPRLDNITPNNKTTCSYRSASNTHICVTLCQEDFCNGPQPVPNITNNTCNETGENATCGAGRPLYMLMPGPLGVFVDSVLGNAVTVPCLVYVVSVVFMF